MLIVDRLEGEYAVCENPETQQYSKLPKVLLPQGLREGDCLLETPEGWKLDAAETLRRRRAAQALLDQLYQ